MKIQTTRRFDKAYAKLTDDDKDRVDDALRLFEKNPFNPSLDNHKLKGKLKEFRAITAGYDLRLVYREEGGHVVVIFLSVGTHDQVY
jgi:addiction module RelE/StbE family toxin